MKIKIKIALALSIIASVAAVGIGGYYCINHLNPPEIQPIDEYSDYNILSVEDGKYMFRNKRGNTKFLFRDAYLEDKLEGSSGSFVIDVDDYYGY